MPTSKTLKAGNPELQKTLKLLEQQGRELWSLGNKYCVEFAFDFDQRNAYVALVRWCEHVGRILAERVSRDEPKKLLMVMTPDTCSLQQFEQLIAAGIGYINELVRDIRRNKNDGRYEQLPSRSTKGRRPNVPEDSQLAVLTKSKRRCALCWGIDHVVTPQKGQIAHIDGNPKNNVEDNLVWLCLPHHDLFDARMSQSKGFRASEVKHYRNELYKGLASGEIAVGDAALKASLPAIHTANAGRDVVIGNVTNVIHRDKRARSSDVVIPGTVADNAMEYNYLQYLARRFNEFRKWECDQAGQPMKWQFIHVSYQREMKFAVGRTPRHLFGAGVSYLQRRIQNSMVGRIKAKEGNRLFQTFEEYCEAPDS